MRLDVSPMDSEFADAVLPGLDIADIFVYKALSLGTGVGSSDC